MDEIVDFLMDVGNYFIATVRNGKATLRPFGVILYEGDSLYICTNREKEVAQDLLTNTSFEIGAVKMNNDWIRVTGFANETFDKTIKDLFFVRFPFLNHIWIDNKDSFIAYKLDVTSAYIETFDKTKKTLV
jgi:uncharacterized pyridoxamine 5'-phosphate oxidase family protein